MGVPLRLAELTQSPGCDQKLQELGQSKLWGCDDKHPLAVEGVSVESGVLKKCYFGLRVTDAPPPAVCHLMSPPWGGALSPFAESPLSLAGCFSFFPSALGEWTTHSIDLSGGLLTRDARAISCRQQKGIFSKEWELGGSLDQSPERHILFRWLIILPSPERSHVEYKEGENTVLSMLFFPVMAPS